MGKIIELPSREDDDDFDGLDFLISFMQEECADGRNNLTVVNKTRMEQMQFCYKMLQRIFAGQDVLVTQEVEEDFRTMGSISVEGESLSFAEDKWFTRIAGFADNLEIFPFANNRVGIGLMFYNITSYIN